MVLSEYDDTLAMQGSELASLSFYLADNISFSEQHHRGEIWVVIQNNVNNKHFSTTPLVRDFVELFRKKSTLDYVFEHFAGANQLPVEQWVELISKLMQANILLSAEVNHDDHRFQQFIDQEKKMKRSKWSRPWMLKIPLGNPNTLLDRLSSKTNILFTVPMFFVWIALIVFGVFEAADHFSDLKAFWATRFLDPYNIILALIIYPVLKFFHELGHGLAAKKWGADVLETGVLLILFVPLPYVDVSQSTFFRSKYQRMVVAAAGMMVELTIAVAALFVWIASDSIFIRDVCMNIILIGAVSSIFFNANPLLKFDGYYLLSDYLEIPNLSARSGQMCKSVLYQYVFKLPVPTVAYSLAEARWLTVYGVFSQLYRLMLSFYIALYLGGQYFFIGIALGLWLIANQIIRPWFLGIQSLLNEAKVHSASLKVEAILSVNAAILFALFFMVPWQLSQTYSGVLLLDGPARVQVQASGFVAEILVAHNQQVEVDQPLIILFNPNIQSELDFLQAKMNENKMLAYQFQADDPSQAAYYTDLMNVFRDEWNNLQQEKDANVVRSPVAGSFQQLSLENIEGRYLSKGDVIGSVVSAESLDAIVMLGEEEMRHVERFKSADMLIPSSGNRDYRVVGVFPTPSATDRLPSAYLGSLHGGDIAVDSKDVEGLEMLKPMFQVKLGVDTQGDVPRIGSRVELKLSDTGKTLSQMAYQKVINVLRDRSILD